LFNSTLSFFRHSCSALFAATEVPKEVVNVCPSLPMWLQNRQSVGMVTVQFAVRITSLLSASTKVFVPAKLMTGNGAV
jgi:hypothetical protein